MAIQDRHSAEDILIARELLDFLENKAAFYYPDLLERQYDYMYLATDIRWRMDEYIYEAKLQSEVIPFLHTIKDICDDFQTTIYYHSHPNGAVEEIKLPKGKLRELVAVFRQQMSQPIARVVAQYHLGVGSNFAATMLRQE